MKLKSAILGTLAVICALAFPTFARGQALPTATARRLSVFAGANGTFTGLNGSITPSEGRNLGITAGVDLGLRTFFHFEPAIEVRGTYPVASGQVDSQRNILFGLQVSRRFGVLHPYADILIGRGEVDYLNGGYPDPASSFKYTKSTSNVIAPGVGLDLDITRHIALKGDGQLPRYKVPVTSSGSLYAKSVTFGIVYRLGL